MTTNSTDPVQAPAEHRTIRVTVNNLPVGLPDREVTGLEIKRDAIGQGVEIQLDFPLSAKRGDRYVPVDDNELVRVREGEKFMAVAPDDNS
jgi:hypothetical protein